MKTVYPPGYVGTISTVERKLKMVGSDGISTDHPE
jgi:hypothetical protein